LMEFVKRQPKGIHTVINPEGQQIPFTVSKKILLARAILHRPKLLILKDPLEYFDKEEAVQIIDYLVSPDKGWAMIVSSHNPLWSERCTRTVLLKDGMITH